MTNTTKRCLSSEMRGIADDDACQTKLEFRPMELLNDAEIRVLGSLIEKEITTPDYYPLSLNALVAACNQLSSRNPVTNFDEQTVARAADTLREKNLVHVVDRAESRVSKYRHVLYEAMDLGRPAIAVMCIL